MDSESQSYKPLLRAASLLHPFQDSPQGHSVPAGEGDATLPCAAIQ